MKVGNKVAATPPKKPATTPAAKARTPRKSPVKKTPANKPEVVQPTSDAPVTIPDVLPVPSATPEKENEMTTPDVNQTDLTDENNENGSAGTQDVPTTVIENGEVLTTPEEKPEEKPAFVIPDDLSELDFGDDGNTKAMMMEEITLDHINLIREITKANETLTAQKQNFTRDALLEFSEQNAELPEGSDEQDVQLKALYDHQDELRKQFKDAQEKMLTYAMEMRKSELMSEDAVKELETKRAADIENAKSAEKFVANYIAKYHEVAPAAAAMAKQILDVAKIPGTRGSGGTKTTSGNARDNGQTGGSKPRLHGGTIKINTDASNPDARVEFDRFIGAAKWFQNKLGRKVTSEDVKDAWLSAQNVDDWKLTEMFSTFKYGGYRVDVIRNEDPNAKK